MAESANIIDLAARRHVEGEEPRTAQVLSFAAARAQYMRRLSIKGSATWPGADPNGYVIDLPEEQYEERT